MATPIMMFHTFRGLLNNVTVVIIALYTMYLSNLCYTVNLDEIIILAAPLDIFYCTKSAFLI